VASRFVAFGELLLRLDPRGHDRLVQAEEFRARYTGAEANVAVSLACFGRDAAVVSRVPDHEIRQACVNYLRRFGVDVGGVVRGGDRLGIVYVETGASQRPSRVVYDRTGTSLREARPEEFDWDRLLTGRDWFHFSGTAPALGPNVQAVLKDALRAARRLGLTVSCDANYRSKLWGPEEAGRVLGDLLEEVDAFIGGAEDAEKVFGIRPPPGASPAEFRVEAAAVLRRRFGLRHVAMTIRGGDSASEGRLAGFIADGAGAWESREYEMEIVDRIGGGDAFTAGIVHGLLAGWEPSRTVEFAAAAACLKHSVPGDFNLVTAEEVEALVAGRGGSRVVR
jgi:2-dehydro-3-deoxygluconokinase